MSGNQGARRLRKRRDRYHHGELRGALVAAALRVISRDGVAALNLRDLARRLGVSHAAPAHHFPDRAALLAALAGDGFLRLRDALAAGAAGGGRARGGKLLGATRAFVAFALDDPGSFRVMFGPHVGDLPRAPTPIARAGAEGYRVLQEAVEEIVGPGDPRVPSLTFAAWSLLHGACTLFLDGVLPRQIPELADRRALEGWVERGVEALWVGTARPRG